MPVVVNTTEPNDDRPFTFASEFGEIQLGHRICIYGRGGKTSLSRALGEMIGLPVIELDAIFWLPNWVQRDTADMLEIVETRISDAKDGWIMDGNYSKIRPHVLPLADAVIWLNLPRWLTTLRIAKRTLSNVVRRNRICGENYETLRTALSRNSIIWYTAIHGKTSQTRIGRELADPSVAAKVYEIRTYRELRNFYRYCGLDHRDHLT